MVDVMKKKEEETLKKNVMSVGPKKKGEQPKHDPILEREGGIYCGLYLCLGLQKMFVSCAVDRRGGKKEKPDEDVKLSKKEHRRAVCVTGDNTK